MDTAAEKVFRCKLENVVGKPLQTILPNVNLPKEATHVSIFNFRTYNMNHCKFCRKRSKIHLAFPTLSQRCTISVLQPFAFNNFSLEHPVR